MILIYCPNCGDIYNLIKKTKKCSCGLSKGYIIEGRIYHNYYGTCIAMNKFEEAYKLQKIEDAAQKKYGKPINCKGQEFIAEIIPKKFNK